MLVRGYVSQTRTAYGADQAGAWQNGPIAFGQNGPTDYDGRSAPAEKSQNGPVQKYCLQWTWI